MPSTPASVLAALALAGALVGAGVATSTTPATTTPAPSTQHVSVETEERPADRISIECGGYDADGNVVTEAATRIDHAPVDAAGIPQIPAVCGGYTADGTFIGDD